MTGPLREASLDWVNRPRTVALPDDGPGQGSRRARQQPRTLVLRAAAPGDRPELARMHSRCSLETLLQRYLSLGPALSPDCQARLLTTTLALVAVDDRAAVHALGNLTHVSPHQAELDVLVEDAYHGRGVGTVIARHLAAAARLAGYRTVTVRMLPSSPAAARVCECLGAREVSGGPEVLTRTVTLGVASLTGLAAA